ncbi:hypothetical protein ACHAWF_014165 [Thalassiosira exigua]
MGNAPGKSHKGGGGPSSRSSGPDRLHSSLHDLNRSQRGNGLSEREAQSAWYRYGVPVTDVYDVVEVLGQGHMGEVFTVRRKTTGHHTDLTRERAREHEDDLRYYMLDGSDLIANRGESGGGKLHSKGGRKGSKGPSLGGAVHKTKKVMKLSTGPRKSKGGGGKKTTSRGVTESMNSDLTAFIKDEGIVDSHHEPPSGDAAPVKSIMRHDVRYGHHGGSDDAGSSPPGSPRRSTDLPATVPESREGGGERASARGESFRSPASEAASSSANVFHAVADRYAAPTSVDELGCSSRSDPGASTSSSKFGRSASENSSRPSSSNAALRRTHTSSEGCVRKAARKGVHFQRTFAVKTILTSRIQADQLQELVNEIMIMRKLDHPYVLKLYEVYHVKPQGGVLILNLICVSKIQRTGKLWLVTELLAGGDLSSRKLNEHDTKNVIEQVLRALTYLHRMGIVHRDIKLENIMYENNSKGATVRLIDFGLSRTFDRTGVAGDYVRTPYTMSPEAAVAAGSKKKGAEPMTDKTDVWAVGVIAWIMLSGEFPFIKTGADMNNPDMLDKLKRADCHFGVTWKGRGITPKAKEFVKGCLQADPSKRWTAKQALENLQQSWGPPVDKIWEVWQAEVKKNKKPEYVPPQDLPDDDEDEDDASETGSHTSSSSWLDENDDGEVKVASFDNHARAKNIKRHVQKVVREKQAEVQIEKPIDDAKITMDEVERYTKFGFMKKTVLITMANTMDRGDVPKLRELFMKVDTDDTGTITLSELLQAFREVSPEVDEKRVEALFVGMDRDQSGHIHYAEFLAALAESHGLVTLDRLTEAFDRIDTDGKGYITHDDLKSILGKDYDKEMVDKMIQEGDFNKNNKIDYDELLQLMFSDPVEGDKLAGSISPSGSFGGN